MARHSISRIVALLIGTAAVAFAIPAQAEWGGGYGKESGWGGRGRPGGWNQGGGGSGSVSHGGPKTGKTCYNIVGRPYTYNGQGRCPIS